jgi:hypothetical protein
MHHAKKDSHYLKINTRTGKWSLVPEKISLHDTTAALLFRLEKGNLQPTELATHAKYLEKLCKRAIRHIDSKKCIPVIGDVAKALKKAWMRKKFRALAHAIEQSKNENTERLIHKVLHNGKFYYPDDDRTAVEMQAEQKSRFLNSLAAWAKSRKGTGQAIPPFASFLDPHNPNGFVILFASHPYLRLFSSQTQHTTVLDCDIAALQCTVKEKRGKYVCLCRHPIFGTKTLPFDKNFLTTLHNKLLRFEHASLTQLQQGWSKWAA